MSTSWNEICLPSKLSMILIALSMLSKLWANFLSRRRARLIRLYAFYIRKQVPFYRSNFTLLLSVSLLVNEANRDSGSHAMEAWLSGKICEKSRSWQKFVKIFLQQILLAFHNSLINPAIGEILFQKMKREKKKTYLAQGLFYILLLHLIASHFLSCFINISGFFFFFF